jgi:hypothetical protein
MTAPLYSQEGCQLFEDDGVPGSATSIANENVNGSYEKNAKFRIRIEIENTNNRGGGGGHPFEIWAERNGAGGYFQITGATTYIQVATTIHYADGDADNVSRLTTSTATFDEGALDETGTENVSCAANEHIEIEYCLIITDAASVSDTFDFRVYDNGSPINNYSNTIRITALAPSNRTVSVSAVTLAGSAQTAVISVAAVGLIDGDSRLSAAHHQSGPIIDGNGNLYIVLPDFTTGNAMDMFKSDDNGITWSKLDTSNRPVTGGSGSINSHVAYLEVVDDMIFMATFDGNEDVHFHTFKVSTAASNPDTWVTTDTLVISYTTTGTERAVWISKGDSNNDWIIVSARDIQGTNEDSAFHYSINQGVGWTTDNVLDDGSDSFDNIASWAGYGPDSLDVYVMWRRDDSAELFYRTLTDVDQTPSGHTDVLDFTGHASNYCWHAVVFKSPRDNKEYFVSAGPNTSNVIRSQYVVDQGTPAASTQISAKAILQSGSVNTHQFALTYQGAKVICVFIDATTSDIWMVENDNNGGWTNETEILDAVTASYVWAAAYQRSGAWYLGVIWRDGVTTDVYYFTVALDTDIYAGAASLVGAPQDATVDVVTGATAVMQEVTLAGSLQSVTPVGGAISVLMEEVTLVGGPQTISVSSPPPPLTIPMSESTLVSSAQDASVVVGGVIVTVQEITLAGSLESSSVAPGGITVSLDPLTIAGSAETASVLPGEVTIVAQYVTLSSSAQILTIAVGGVIVAMQEISLAGSLQSLTVAPGGITVTMQDVSLVSSAQSAVITIGQTVPVDALSLVGSAQGSSVVPGGTSVSMSEITLAGSLQSLSVIAPSTVSVQTITLASSPQSASIVIGGVTVTVDPITLAAVLQNAQIVPGAISVIMSATTLASSMPSGSVIPGGVTMSMLPVTLSSTIQTLSVLPGGVIISASEITLAGSLEDASVVPGGISVGMGTATLVSSAEDASVSLAEVVPVDALTLVGSARTASVSPGAVTVTMQDVTLVSDPQGFSVLRAETISMQEVTLASSVPAASVSSAYVVQLDALTLASSAQNASLSVGGVSVSMSSVTLASSILSITLDTPVTISMDPIALASTPQSTSIIPGGVSVGLQAVSLLAQAQVITIPAGDVIIPMSEITLSGTAQVLQIQSSVAILMGTATLASSAETASIVPGGVTVQMSPMQLIASMPSANPFVAALVWAILHLRGSRISTKHLQGERDSTRRLRGVRDTS